MQCGSVSLGEFAELVGHRRRGGAHRLVRKEAPDVERETIRIPLGDGRNVGLAGECARSRRIIRVDDAYADQRFNPEVDRRTGFRTRSILTLPLLDHKLVEFAAIKTCRKVEPFTSCFMERDQYGGIFPTLRSITTISHANGLP